MRAALIAASLALLLDAGHAVAAPNQQLAAADRAFRQGQFGDALPLYNALLYPVSKLADRDDIVTAYVNLGVCRVDAGDVEGAKREFEKALGLDSNHQLDPLVVTNKAAIRLFDDTKADLRNRARETADKEALANAIKERELLRKNTILYESHSLLLNFAPFGIGQFQNDDTAKGVLFASTESIALVTSISTWYYLVSKYGLNNQHLRIDANEASTVHSLQVLEIGSGIAFFGLWVVGVVDAYRNYQPQVRRKVDDTFLRDVPEYRDLTRPKPKKTSLRDRLHLAPMITPNGAGLGVGWEN